jgi:ribosomal protein L24
MKVGDRIIVTQGDFKGDRGSITHKTWFTKGLKVALEKNGDEIKTKEGHVQLAD